MSNTIRVPLGTPGTKPERLETAIPSDRGGEIAVLHQALPNRPSIASDSGSGYLLPSAIAPGCPLSFVN